MVICLQFVEYYTNLRIYSGRGNKKASKKNNQRLAFASDLQP